MGRRAVSLAGLAMLCASCSSMGTVPPGDGPAAGAAIADSATVAIWHFDEPMTRDALADHGPSGLHAFAAPSVDTDDGCSGFARTFNGDHDSFLLVPWKPGLDTSGPVTIEACIDVRAAAREIGTIAAQWTSKLGGQSWLFGYVGDGSVPSLEVPSSTVVNEGCLFFAYVSKDRSTVQTFRSRGCVERGWHRVAVTLDGREIRFYIDGRFDSGEPALGELKRMRLPLTIGGFASSVVEVGAGEFWFQGVDGAGFVGSIDEVKISSRAR